jgi:putative aldouronate transport system permease protein
MSIFKIEHKPKSRLSAVSLPTEIIFHVIIGVFALMCIVPFIFCIIISFTSKQSIVSKGFSFFPQSWSLDGYKYVFATGHQLWLSYFNSLFVSVAGTALSVFICVLYSYALYRKDFKYRRFFTFFAVLTMLFSGGLAPTYEISKNLLGLSDNYWALIVPLLVNPFNLIIMRTFFKASIPEALIEAAAIDGSGEYNTLFKIVLPISLPGIATVSLLTILAYWNDWFQALLYISDGKYYPLQYLLWQMQSQVDFLAANAGKGLGTTVNVATLPTQSLRMALVVLIVIPIALAYPFFQRYVVSGLTVGSVKE